MNGDQYVSHRYHRRYRLVDKDADCQKDYRMDGVSGRNNIGPLGYVL